MINCCVFYYLKFYILALYFSIFETKFKNCTSWQQFFFFFWGKKEIYNLSTTRAKWKILHKLVSLRKFILQAYVTYSKAKLTAITCSTYSWLGGEGLNLPLKLSLNLFLHLKFLEFPVLLQAQQGLLPKSCLDYDQQP